MSETARSFISLFSSPSPTRASLEWKQLKKVDSFITGDNSAPFQCFSPVKHFDKCLGVDQAHLSLAEVVIDVRY